MIKKLIKILSVTLFLIVLLIIYLSFIGIKTDKFNESIKNRVSEINRKITLDLKDIKLLLNPFNFTVIITAKDPRILLGNSELQIRSIKINVSLKSVIFDKFSIEELQVSTKPITLNDIILLARSFKNSTELFLLNKIIKDGFLIADIKLNFNKSGKIKKNYQINGFIKDVKFNFLNQINAKNLNLNFNISKNKYSLTEINAKINDVKVSSKLIEIIEKEDFFSISGKVLTSKKSFNREQLNFVFGSFLKNLDIEKVKFNSENNISFNVSKKFKFNGLNIESKINLDQLDIKNNFLLRSITLTRYYITEGTFLFYLI